MKFLALELLHEMDSYNEHNLPDLTKADVFALGATLYSLMTCTIFLNFFKNFTKYKFL